MDHFQVLKQSTIQSLFEDEYLWMKRNRWWMAANHQANMLLLLGADNMSLHHLNQVRQWMQAEKNEIAKKDEEAKLEVRDSSSLTGGYNRV